jgi:hypothetical protein
MQNGLPPSNPGQPEQAHMSEPIEAFDLLIEGGTVLDGTRAPRFDADVALLAKPDKDFKVSQGVTTVVTGNCGIGPAPLEPDTPSPAPSAYPPATTTRPPRRPAPKRSQRSADP